MLSPGAITGRIIVVRIVRPEERRNLALLTGSGDVGGAGRDKTRVRVAAAAANEMNRFTEDDDRGSDFSMIWMAPDARAGVVVLTNSDAADAPRLATQLLRIVLGLPEHAHKEIAVDARAFDGYLGVWQLGDSRITIAREGDRLFAQLGAQRFSLSPESAREFVVQGTDAHLVFSRDRNGLLEVIVRQSGIETYLNLVK